MLQLTLDRTPDVRPAPVATLDPLGTSASARLVSGAGDSVLGSSWSSKSPATLGEAVGERKEGVKET